VIAGRLARRLLAAPRTRPEEASLGPALDRLGGELTRIRSRDGLRLSARWLAADSTGSGSGPGSGPGPGSDPGAGSGDATWTPDSHEAVLLLHGYSGSVAPDLLEYGPTLRRTAGVLGLDFRGHGESDAADTTFGLREVDDVGGALAWLGERGVRRVALVGTSMGGIAAIAATVVLGDGRLPAVDIDPNAPVIASPAPRPQVVGLVVESVPYELPTVVANRIPGPGPVRRWLARRAFIAVARLLGDDPRATEPGRALPLLEDLPVLLIHGEADNNPGTFPINSERLYQAIRGNGGTVRLVMLPFESHGYAARESVEHTVWEMLTWFDKYVKNAPSQSSSR
jgi:pimeloyl-ACP methyl ester carboxylesterase